MLLKSIVRIFVKYGGNALGFGVAGDAALELWDLLNKSKPSQREKMDEIQQLAGQSTEQARQNAAAVVAQEAADQPETVRQALTAYLTQLPNAIRQSQRRPQDPTGKTVSSQLRLQQPADLVALLPPRLPRFKPGDRPLPGVDWELEKLVGMGGFGEVWKAKNPFRPHAASVALKFCLDTEAARALRNEVQLLDHVESAGRHAGIVPLLRTYLSAEPPCLEYEYVNGGDLTSLVYKLLKQNQGKLPVEVVTKIMRPIIRAVGHAHRLKPPIVHRDLKPANILVHRRPEDGKVDLRIADFGIGGVAAKCAIEQAPAESPSGQFMTMGVSGSCTPLYASQQQMGGEDPDPRDDVHALGVIWYQLLVGDLTVRPPTDWHDELADRQVPEAIIRLIGSCISSRAEKRPADAAALAEELAKLSSLPPPPDPGQEFQPGDTVIYRGKTVTFIGKHPTQDHVRVIQLADGTKKRVVFRSLKGVSSDVVTEPLPPKQRRPSPALKTDRAYWEQRAPKEMLQIADGLLRVINRIEPKATFRYVKNLIGVEEANGAPIYYIHLFPRKSCVLLSITMPQSEEVDRQLREAKIDSKRKGKFYDLKITGPLDANQEGAILDMLRKAAEAYRKA